MDTLVVRITKEDKELVFEAAHISRLSMSEFIRSIIVKTARDVVSTNGGKK